MALAANSNRHLSESAAPAAGGEQPSAPTRTITAAAKARLRACFEKMNWPLNKPLPRGEGYNSSELGAIAAQFGLKKTQVALQLRNFKDEKYGNTQVKLILEADQLESRMRESLSMTSTDYVCTTLERIFDKNSSSSSDFMNFTAVLDALPDISRGLLKMMVVSPDQTCCTLLADLVDSWVKITAECIPKTAAGLPSAEVEFQKKRRDLKIAFLKRWMEEYGTVGVENQLDRKKFGALGSFLCNILYLDWSQCSVECEKPQVSFPGESLVGKYARPMVYYVAGWTLVSASQALTIALGKREIYFTFARAHTITREQAVQLELPTGVVDRRKRRRAKVYCTRQYFDFICFVETVFLSNLTLKMMRAHADGKIVDKIMQSILSSESAVEKFSALCDNQHCSSLTEDDQKQIMKYMLERYSHMRGRYFVRHLNANGRSNLVNNLQANQATRTKVANAVVCAKAVADAKEKQLWLEAEASVCDYADSLESGDAAAEDISLHN